MRRVGYIGIALALVAAGAPDSSASVASSGGYKYVTKQYEDISGYQPSLKAKCPHGTHVLGGGQYNTAPNQGLRTHHSAPLDTNDPGKVTEDGWHVALESFGTYTVYVQAICGRRPVKYVKDKFIAAAQGRTGPVPLECPGTTAPMSGGTTGSDLAYEVATFPGFPNAWNVTVDSGSANALTLHLYAVCAKFGLVGLGSSDTVPPSGETTITADCTGDRRVVGGGTSPTGSLPNTAIVNSLHPTTIHDGWTVVVDNTWNQSFTAASYALCAKPAH